MKGGELISDPYFSAYSFLHRSCAFQEVLTSPNRHQRLLPYLIRSFLCPHPLPLGCDAILNTQSR